MFYIVAERQIISEYLSDKFFVGENLNGNLMPMKIISNSPKRSAVDMTLYWIDKEIKLFACHTDSFFVNISEDSFVRIREPTMRTLIHLALSLTIVLKSGGECSNILAFICNMAHSHHIVFQPILRKLASRGHNVDYYTHLPMADPPKNLNHIVFTPSEKAMVEMDKINMVEWGQLPAISISLFMREYKLMEHWSCHTTPEVKELFASNKSYDLVIGEFFFSQEHFTYLMHKFNALGVVVSSVPDSYWLSEMSGLPINPSYMADLMMDYSGEFSFAERIVNFLNLCAIKMIDYGYLVTRYQWSADHYFRYDGWQTRPPIGQMASNVSLVLTNSHHSVGYPYPLAPHVKEILGTNVEQNPKPLPQDIQDYMDSAEHGVILFSLGSIVSVKELKVTGGYDALVKVFGRLKQKVLWKWTTWLDEDAPNDLPNIKMSKWLPQNSILAHNKTRLFITHGGIGSTTESIYHRVPMIGIPVFADQFKNTRFMASEGCGVRMDFLNISEASMTWAINEVLNNPRYKIEVTRRSELFNDRPMKPVDESVYWIEYVLKHGNILQPASARLPFYQLYLLDILAALIAGILIAALIIRGTFRFIMRGLKKETPCAKNNSNVTTREVRSKKID